MKQIGSILLALSLVAGTAVASGQIPPVDQPKAEKKVGKAVEKRKVEKAKNDKSDADKGKDKDKGKGKGDQKSGKRKAEEPKAQ